MTNEELRDILRQFDLEEKTIQSLTHPPLAAWIGGIRAETWVQIAAEIEAKSAPNKAFLKTLELLESEKKRADDAHVWALELANKLLAASAANLK